MITAVIDQVTLTQAVDNSHRLEERWLHEDEAVPANEAEDTPFDAIIAFGLSGWSRWFTVPVPGSGGAPVSCSLPADSFAVFPTRSRFLIEPEGGAPAHLLLWRFNIQAVRAMGSMLGQFPSPPASNPHGDGQPPWAAKARPLSPALQALVRALRSAPGGPMQTVWYGAKLLELAALICPAARPRENPPEACLHPAVRQSMEVIQSSYAQPLTLSGIARIVGISPSHLSHLFAEQVKQPLISYLRRVRLEHAAELLGKGRHNVSEAAFSVGYASTAQFSHVFRAHFGYPPSKHRQS